MLAYDGARFVGKVVLDKPAARVTLTGLMTPSEEYRLISQVSLQLLAGSEVLAQAQAQALPLSRTVPRSDSVRLSSLLPVTVASSFTLHLDGLASGRVLVILPEYLYCGQDCTCRDVETKVSDWVLICRTGGNSLAVTGLVPVRTIARIDMLAYQLEEGYTASIRYTAGLSMAILPKPLHLELSQSQQFMAHPISFHIQAKLDLTLF